MVLVRVKIRQTGCRAAEAARCRTGRREQSIRPSHNCLIHFPARWYIPEDRVSIYARKARFEFEHEIEFKYVESVVRRRVVDGGSVSGPAPLRLF